MRVELRVFGMVQFDPLRVWVSRHGFTRCGTPTLNYSTAVSLNNSNLQMWNINSGVDGVCSAAVRRLRRYSKHLSSKPCDCMMMGDTLDTAHGEAGFSTTGTFATIDHVARRENRTDHDLEKCRRHACAELHGRPGGTSSLALVAQASHAGTHPL